ncbi:PREDICTED: facilitated trehalose transporter Tret1-like [Polistes dominula]|uniref:Facilitated trehalose transporter Tret1-like n=1 Tax=Polistes dominula TaxID=743375 RepID=A0ABM1J8B5_POLDO|nr:PREDICTED: facilitated trehalose transporter Tret1-like [Polistes dominula]
MQGSMWFLVPYIMWYLARFLSGISLGLGFLVAPIYLGEISSVKTRGANGTMISIMCNLGILLSFITVPLGRKLIILVSGIITGLLDLTISSYFYAKDYFKVDVSSYYVIPVIASISTIFFCNFGFCSVLLIMMSEIFAVEVKVLSSCILGIISGILAMINGKLYILLAISLNYGHGLPFLGFCLFVWVNTALLYYMSPETKGKTFIEIQRELQD